MPLLSARSLLRLRGGRLVFRDVSFTVDEGECIGLVGANGSGKSSLLRLVAGLDWPDEGSIEIEGHRRVAFLEQGHEIPGDRLVWDWALEGCARLRQMEGRLAELVEAVSQRPDDEAVLANYGELCETFERAGGYGYESRLRGALVGLGVAELLFSRRLGDLSGGERARVALARFLVAGEDLMLLDEPGNHLDLSAMSWLARWLGQARGTVLLASHDRSLLSGACSRHLEFEGGRVIPRPADWIASGRCASGRDRLVPASKGRRGLELDVLDEGPATVLEAHGLRRSLAGRSLFSDLDLQLERGERLALLGENGCGKTRLLRLLAGVDEADGGRLHYGVGVNLGYFAQDSAPASAEDSALEALRRVAAGFGESRLRNHLAFFGLREDWATRPMGELSGGQRRRAELARVVMGGHNLLLLDEPCNHLDLPAREALEEALVESPGTLVFVSHDRAFLERVATRCLVFEGGRIYELDDPSRYEGRGAKERKGGAKSPRPPRAPKGEGQKEVRALEREIETLEGEIVRIDGELLRPELHGDGSKMKELLGERGRAEARLAEAWARWEALVEDGG